MLDACKYALVDLHLHVDGSIDPVDALAMARMSGITLPTSDVGELTKLMECPEHAKSLEDYLAKFDLPLRLMQTAPALRYCLRRLVERLGEAGLIYAELRFSPQSSLQGGLSQEEVVCAAIEGMNEGLARCRIKTQLILCCMRNRGNEAQNFETVDVAAKYLGNGVAAVDLAGAEASYPTAWYKSLFAYAKSLEVPFTIHAGEAAGAENVMLALDFGARRIGHGIRCHDDAVAKSRLRRLGATLEICPTSNLDTFALEGVRHMEQYPIQDFIRDGVKVTINTDDMTVSNTSLNKEFTQLLEARVLSPADARACVCNAIDAAFLPEEEKKSLLSKAMERMA